MSLVGSLEDLSFPDILQIIHVSRQSGTLVLNSPDGERQVRFRKGLVCGATLGREGPELEELLVQRGLVAPAALPHARARQEATGESLTAALVGLGSVSQGTIDRLVRDEIRSLLGALILRQEGAFRFDLEAENGPANRHEVETVEELEPESILDGLTDHEPLSHSEGGREPAGKAQAHPAHILLVSERAALRQVLKEELAGNGLEVTACHSPREAREKARDLAAQGVSLGLVCDLILPDETETGWRGALDLLREMRALSSQLVALVMGEVPQSSAEEAARLAGADIYIQGPDLTESDWVDVGDRLREFSLEVCDALRPLRQGERRPRPSRASSLRVTDPLSLLSGLIGEMRSETSSEVPLLVLRLAAEYFERGVLFSVGDGEVYGTGAFGPQDRNGGDEELESRIRGTVLPVVRGSALHRVVHEGVSLKGSIPADDVATAALWESLGEPPPEEAALLPLSSGSEVFGVFCGDNYASGRPLGDLKALEIFFNQAGVMLQNALLRRRIASLSPAAEDGAPRTGRVRV